MKRQIQLTRLDVGLSVLVGLVSLTLYARTLAPSLLYGDSAEFQTIAYTLGIGHPTGYPVYIFLARLFTFLPVGDIAYRVNLLSAVAAAATIALLYLILCRLGAWRIPAALSVFTLAFVDLFWKHACIAEIYTVASACLAGILYTILAWRGSGNPRWLFAAGLLGGLSLGIHTTVALSAIAILLYLVLAAPQKAGWLQAALGAVAGVFVFLLSFLVLDALDASAGYYNTVVRHALSVWDLTPADFDSPFERLAFLYFPPQFSGQFFAVPLAQVQERLIEFFGNASWSIVIALVGLASLLLPRQQPLSSASSLSSLSFPRWREAILLLIAFTTFLLFAASYNVYDYYVFYLPAIAILVIAIGLGFNALQEALLLIPRLPRFIPGIVVGALILANLGDAFPQLLESWKSRLPPFVEDHEIALFTFPETRRLEAQQLLEKLEDNAIIFTDWDTAYNFYYVAHVLQGRVGMDFHETYPQEGASQLADSTLAYIESNLDTRPIYFTERPLGLTRLYKIQRTGSGLYRLERK
ncbi:MAG: DUF2723 domain-containing protein [Chloroflexota bacterium]